MIDDIPNHLLQAKGTPGDYPRDMLRDGINDAEAKYQRLKTDYFSHGLDMREEGTRAGIG
jgi:hypothetical protein